MSISRLRRNRSTLSVLMAASRMAHSAALGELLTSEPQPQPELQIKPRRQRAKQAASKTSSLTSSTLNNFANMGDMGDMNGVRLVGQASKTVKTVNESTPNLTTVQPQLPNRRKLPQGNDQDITKAHSKRKRDPRTGRDETRVPSKASGGIPNATPEYLSASKFLPQPLGNPQHLLVVIDLNGTLLYRPSRKQPTKFVPRPHAQTFLKYCVDTFTVVIWSSARLENVTNMCNTILKPDIRERVIAIWGRDKFGLSKFDFDSRVQCYKRLTKIWQDQEIATSHPLYHDGHRWDQSNTVLIDDTTEKARSEPYNLIEVPEWFGDPKEVDDILPQVHDYLNHLSMHSNVSACLHAQPWKPAVVE